MYEISRDENIEVIFVTSATRHDVIFSDLYNDNRVHVLRGQSKIPKNKLLKFLHRIHFSGRLNKFFEVPFKSIWSYSLREIKWSKGKKYYVVFQCNPAPISIQYLNELKESYDVSYFLLLLDSWNSVFVQKAMKYISANIFDAIFTFDETDAKIHNLHYCYVPYSLVNYDHDVDVVRQDLYFMGSNKGRLKIQHDIFELSMENDVSAYFRIVGVKREFQKFTGKIIYNSPILYSDSIEEVIGSNCILDILSSGQTGATLRYYEAVCYNKKLLTNNKNVVNLPFYNPDYIHVFEKPEDIDWNWVKERIPVDYHYDGRFSPTHLIDKIIELEEEKERNELGKVETD